MFETHTKGIVQSPTEKLSQREETCHQRASQLVKRSIGCRSCRLVEDSRLVEIMDETVVCFKTRFTRPLQKSQSKKQPLGWHDPPKFLQSDRTSQQERWFLF